MSAIVNHLLALVGDWRGTETIESTPWGAGGPAMSQITAKAGCGGRVLIQDYSAERDDKVWLQAHAVFHFDAARDAYQLFWFDSLGFVPAQPAEGTWNAGVLSFVRTSARGHTRHVYTQVSDDEYRMQLDTSFDGGASWLPVMAGLYTRST